MRLWCGLDVTSQREFKKEETPVKGENRRRYTRKRREHGWATLGIPRKHRHVYLPPSWCSWARRRRTFEVVPKRPTVGTDRRDDRLGNGLERYHLLCVWRAFVARLTVGRRARVSSAVPVHARSPCLILGWDREQQEGQCAIMRSPTFPETPGAGRTLTLFPWFHQYVVQKGGPWNFGPGTTRWPDGDLPQVCAAPASDFAQWTVKGIRNTLTPDRST